MNLHLAEAQRLAAEGWQADPVEPAGVDLRRLIALGRRRLHLGLAAALTVLFGAMLAMLAVTPLYTATAQVVLDPRQQKVTDAQEVLSGLPAGTGVVDTEVEVLRSRGLTDHVVAALGLDRDPEFAPPGAVDRAAVVDRVLKRLRVGRIGLTSVIDIAFTSASPGKAARIADAFADRYLLQSLDASSTPPGAPPTG